MSILGDLKDRVVRLYINSQVKEYAEVLNLEINSKEKSIAASVQLKGQASPLQVRVDDYRIAGDGDDAEFTWTKITVEPGSVKLPPGLKSKLDMVL